jgi:ABC-type branched-subunit amino acid transport system ATPase component
VTDSPAPAAAANGNGHVILDAEDVVMRFDGIRAVDGATLSVRKGSITALIGPNGAGKTTLFNVLTGFYRPHGGSARFAGTPVLGRPPYAIARLGMVRTFQITKALAAMPVIDNMLLAGPNQPGESLVGLLTRPRRARQRENQLKEHAYALLRTFDLDQKADAYAGTLSGGQRKLLELARALMTEPIMVLLDEPMAGINPTLGRRLLEHMQELRQDHQVTFLFVEHDMDVVMNHADEVVVMAQGAVIAEGEPEEIREDPRVIDAYLGGGPSATPRPSAKPEKAQAPAAETVLRVSDLVAGYTPEVDILNGVDVEVNRGEIVTIVGPNGAGKSTLMKSIFGLLRPRDGRVELHGEEITGELPHNVTRRGVSYVPQLDNVFPSLTVQENLELGMIARTQSSLEERIELMFGLFPRLQERPRQQAGTMSGGERQMVAMARALMPEPDLLLLDEPSAGLAPAFVDAIFEKVEEINAAGVTVLMVEQNARRALAMSDRGYVLDLGQNRFEGTGSSLLADPKVADLYLGGGRGRLDAEAPAGGSLGT